MSAASRAALELLEILYLLLKDTLAEQLLVMETLTSAFTCLQSMQRDLQKIVHFIIQFKHNSRRFQLSTSHQWWIVLAYPVNGVYCYSSHESFCPISRRAHFRKSCTVYPVKVSLSETFTCYWSCSSIPHHCR